MKTEKDLQRIACIIRKDIVKMAYNAGKKGAHIGGGMSAADIMAVLYGEVMNINPQEPTWDLRDRFIMSKAHSAIAQYAALHYAGFIGDKEIADAMSGRAVLYKHPKMNLKYGIEFSGGSLGQGLALGAGTGLALKRKGNSKSKVYVLIGDGECDEGSVWEAASSIVHYDLKNVVSIIDSNKLQNDGQTEKIMRLGDMKERWKSLGFDCIEIDGHNVLEIRDALLQDTVRPKAIIANTVKGKGISFAENCVEWHIGYLNDELYAKAMEELS